MYEFFSKFTVSNWLEFVGIIVSLLTSITAIVISIKTLKQNSKMIEESTRPYITICGKTTNFQSPNFYLVLKNYGSSGAIITKFTCNHNLGDFSFDSNYVPYKRICGTFIAPNQSFITNLDTNKLFESNTTLIFDIEYKSQNKTYTEHFEILMESYKDLIQTRASTRNQELKIISYALQDLSEKHL